MCNLLTSLGRLLRNLARIAVVTTVLVALYLVLDALLLPGEARQRPAD